MKPFIPILAENFFLRVKQSPVLLVCSVLALIILVALIRVIFFGKRHRRHHRHDQGHRERPDNAPANKKDAAPSERRSEHRHRKRRKQLPMNPTLAQTRGLPPVRNSDEPPPY